MPFNKIVLLEINYESLSLMLKFAFAMIGLLLLIWLLAVITPKLAKVIDRMFGRVKIDKGTDTMPVSDDGKEVYKVYDIYDGAKLTAASRELNNNNEEISDDI